MTSSLIDSFNSFLIMVDADVMDVISCVELFERFGCFVD